MRKNLMRKAVIAAVLLTAAAAGAQSESPSDQFLDVMRKDHALVLATIEKIQSGEGDRQQTLTEQRNLLLPHMKGEEDAFYPALQQASGSGAAKQALKEHQEARLVLQRILQMDPNDPQMAGQINLLKEGLQAHIKSEEEEVVPMAAQKMDSARLHTVLADFQTSKAKAAQNLR